MSASLLLGRRAALVLALLLVASSVPGQVPREGLSAELETPPASRLDDPVLRSMTVAIAPEALRSDRMPVGLTIFDDLRLDLVLEAREDLGPGEFTWTGHVDSDLTSRVVFACAGGELCGTVRVGDRLLRLSSRGPVHALLEEIDEHRVPPCTTTSAHRVVTSTPLLPPPPPAVASSALVVSPVIDVMVVYTPAARAGQGGTAAMQALIDLAVLETNQAYQQSGVAQRLRLVHRAELPGYVESGNWGIDMGRLFNPSDGQIDYVHTWRARSGADAVVMMMDAQGGNCGVAFLMGTLDPGFAPNAWALVSRTCATGFYTFGHELGHVFGLAHDRDNGSDKTMRASYSSALLAGNAPSRSGVVSAFGTHVAFVSDANNLVAGDANGIADVFLRDRPNYTTVRIDVSSAGAEANGPPVSAPSVSQSGAFVAFDSLASNLVAGDANGVSDVFVRDVSASLSTRVSVATGGAEANGPSFAPALSLDARFVAFASDATNLAHNVTTTQVYLHDRQNGTTVLVSRGTGGVGGNGASTSPSVSADGRFVAFTSTSSDLVANDTNARSDVFVRDLVLGTTVRASVASGGLQSNDDSPAPPTLSADGRWVAFASLASNLVAFDTNGTWDVFVHDRVNSTTVRASLGPSGAQGNGPSGWLARPTLTDDGRFVAFGSRATNLVATDGNGSDDAFVRDLVQGTTFAASVTPSGQLAVGASGHVDQSSPVAIASATGGVVTFSSTAVLEVLDSNAVQDVYVFNTTDPAPPGVDDYSYGYRTPNQQYRTIMAYAPGTRIQYFSNPNVVFTGFPLGVADPDPYSAECWRTLNNTAPTVAAWTSSVYIPFCAGDGSASACPCGNTSPTDSGRGCLNSLSLSGVVSALGTASIASDTVTLRGNGMPDGGVLYFQGTSQAGAGAGVLFGDGLLCVAGTIRRLAVKFNVQNASSLPASGDPSLSVLGGLTAPGTAHYQLWYRDAGAFCSSDTFNLTNALSIVWGG